MASHLSMIFLMYILSGNLLATLIQAEPLKGISVTRVNDTSKYSYVVSIFYKNDRYPEEEMHICSGVLIAKNFVLTAAHCFYERSLDEIQIIIGSVDLRKGIKYDVSMWITYDQWIRIESNKINEQDDLNEIAMIKLSKEVSSQVARPASLSSKQHKDLNYHHVELIGWGKTLESLTHPSRYLHKVKVKVLPNSVCEQMSIVFFNDKSQFDKYLCTKGEPHAFLADGDSGGPVIKRDSVVGISIGACPKYEPCNLFVESLGNYKFNVHIGIDFYREFISNVLNNF